MPCVNWKMLDVTGNEAIGIGSDCNFNNRTMLPQTPNGVSKPDTNTWVSMTTLIVRAGCDGFSPA